jgi:FKBP-type peptidyl-prolyl cis-trans isomerase FkpA
MNRKQFFTHSFFSSLSLTTLSLTTFGALMSTDAAAANTETLPSGVKIMHLTVGTGPSPKASDTVKVHYRGTLENGKEFDSSYKRNAPISFPLQGVIKAWTEGVQKMKVGGKAILVCPPETAYGSRGAGGVIPPNATLTFEIELLAIEK